MKHLENNTSLSHEDFNAQCDYIRGVWARGAKRDMEKMNREIHELGLKVLPCMNETFIQRVKRTIKERLSR